MHQQFLIFNDVMCGTIMICAIFATILPLYGIMGQRVELRPAFDLLFLPFQCFKFIVACVGNHFFPVQPLLHFFLRVNFILVVLNLDPFPFLPLVSFELYQCIILGRKKASSWPFSFPSFMTEKIRKMYKNSCCNFLFLH